MCKERSDGGRIRGFTPHAIEISARIIDTISLAAGYAKGTIYNYFASKEELFLAVVERPRHRPRPQPRHLQRLRRGSGCGHCSPPSAMGRRTRRARGIAVRARSTREPLRGRTGWCRPDSAPSCTPSRPDAWLPWRMMGRPTAEQRHWRPDTRPRFPALSRRQRHRTPAASPL
jgi:AcrR family transcriptional regulator